MTNGFNAPKRGDELSTGPNARIYALESIRDVTGKVKAAIAAAPDALGRANALDDIEKQLVAGCEEGGGYRCRLYSFAGGHTYRLFKNLDIRDVRLVYAPPGSVGAFGGDIYNLMWPLPTISEHSRLAQQSFRTRRPSWLPSLHHNNYTNNTFTYTTT